MSANSPESENQTWFAVYVQSPLNFACRRPISWEYGAQAKDFHVGHPGPPEPHLVDARDGPAASARAGGVYRPGAGGAYRFPARAHRGHQAVPRHRAARRTHEHQHALQAGPSGRDVVERDRARHDDDVDGAELVRGDQRIADVVLAFRAGLERQFHRIDYDWRRVHRSERHRATQFQGSQGGRTWRQRPED